MDRFFSCHHKWLIFQHTKPAEEMFRVMEQNYKVDRERARIIVRFMCGAINLKRGRKRCNAVVELENSRIKAPRQVTLREQVANSDLSGSKKGTTSFVFTPRWNCIAFFLTWINFSPSMDKLLYPSWIVGWNYLSIPKLQRGSLGMDK